MQTVPDGTGMEVEDQVTQEGIYKCNPQGNLVVGSTGNRALDGRSQEQDSGLQRKNSEW